MLDSVVDKDMVSYMLYQGNGSLVEVQVDEVTIGGKMAHCSQGCG